MCDTAPENKSFSDLVACGLGYSRFLHDVRCLEILEMLDGAKLKET